MIYIIGKCDENCLLASRVYAQRFPHRPHPDERKFRKVKDRFERTGSVKYERRSHHQNVTASEENKMSVMLSVIENPHTSCRTIATNLGLGKSSVNKILRQAKFHPYHIKLNQELKPTDFQKRIEFCVWGSEKIAQDPNFLNTLLMTDEASFSSCGTVNRHNFHYYEDRNPHFNRNIPYQYRETVNVWGGIVGDFVIGPHFFEETLTGATYLNFLQNNLPILLEDLPLNIRRSLWLMHDGASVHSTQNVKRYLDDTFPQRWIGRGSDVPWPPRSPDLTTCDFFLWGYVKERVYQEAFTNINNLKQAIRNAFQSIDRNMLLQVRRSFRDRIELCQERNGHQLEHLRN